MRLRASLHCVFSTLMCFLNERCESHHSPRNFVDSSTGRSVFPILTMGGLWARDRGAVKCMTLHLWAAYLKPFLVAHSSMAFTACCSHDQFHLQNPTKPSETPYPMLPSWKAPLPGYSSWNHTPDLHLVCTGRIPPPYPQTLEVYSYLVSQPCQQITIYTGICTNAESVYHSPTQQITSTTNFWQTAKM